MYCNLSSILTICSCLLHVTSLSSLSLFISSRIAISLRFLRYALSYSMWLLLPHSLISITLFSSRLAISLRFLRYTYYSVPTVIFFTSCPQPSFFTFHIPIIPCSPLLMVHLQTTYSTAHSTTNGSTNKTTYTTTYPSTHKVCGHFEIYLLLLTLLLTNTCLNWISSHGVYLFLSNSR